MAFFDLFSSSLHSAKHSLQHFSFLIYTVSQKNSATFIFTVTLATVGRFLNSFNVRIRKKWLITRMNDFPP